jgi:uncharacterized membrane protein YozB (DUF420 family)
LFAPHNVIPVLKIAVGAVTVLLVASLIVLARGNKRLHGQINFAFFILTTTAVLSLELIIRFLNPEFTAGFTPEEKQLLFIHLSFSIPAALLLPLMLYSGKTHKSWHVPLAVVFSVLWIGTFITGIFYLPH